MTTNPRRVVNSTFMSLDGLTEQLQDWHFQYHNDEAIAVALDALAASSDVLMGRLTYESFAAVWPTQTGAYADRMNSIPKWVASTKLTTLDWNNSKVIDGDLATHVARLKSQPGTDIHCYGFGPLARTLLHHGLLNELRIWLHPVLSGKGSASDLMFREMDTLGLTLVNHQPLGSGVVILTYEPNAEPGQDADTGAGHFADD